MNTSKKSILLITNFIKKGFIMNRIQYNKPFLSLKINDGIMACKYIDINTAEKAGDKMVLFQNINDFDDMLNSKVIECTSYAEKVGIKKGMKGSEVIKIFEK